MTSRLLDITRSTPYRHLLWCLNNAFLENYLSHATKLLPDSRPLQLGLDEKKVVSLAMTREVISELEKFELLPGKRNERVMAWPLTSPFYQFEYDIFLFRYLLARKENHCDSDGLNELDVIGEEVRAFVSLGY